MGRIWLSVGRLAIGAAPSRDDATASSGRTDLAASHLLDPLALAIYVGHDGGDNYYAFEHFLVIGVEAKEGEAGDDDAEDDHADHGSGYRSAPAGKRNPADDGHGDGIQFVARAHACLGCQTAGRDDDAG